MDSKEIKKTIDEIVWWIPNRKLRDIIRETFFILYEIKEQNDILLKVVNDNTGFIVVNFGGGFVDQLYLYRFGYSIEKLYGKKFCMTFHGIVIMEKMILENIIVILIF